MQSGRPDSHETRRKSRGRYRCFSQPRFHPFTGCLKLIITQRNESERGPKKTVILDLQYSEEGGRKWMNKKFRIRHVRGPTNVIKF